MGYQPFLITPFKGLSTYYKPFLIGNDAFPDLDNCYSFRGRIKKREGCSLFGRLPMWKTAAGAGTITNTSPPVVTVVGHGLVTGDTVWLENCTGATGLNNTAYSITKINNDKFSLKDLNTGANIDASGAGTNVDVYLPIVGIVNYNVPSTSNQSLIVFHPKRPYFWNVNTLSFDTLTKDPSGAIISWSGTGNNFFWHCNYANSVWVANNNDNICYWNGTQDGVGTGGWSYFTPIVNGSGDFINKALIIIPYKGRLVILRPYISSVLYQNRAIWSQIGTPYTVTDATHVPPNPYGVDANAWRYDIPGKGGYIDADTSESIQSACIINDTLIVGFQYSTWKLVYTGSEVLPFLWQRINTSLGSEATYASVALDDSVMMLSRRGIVKANINEAVRMDMEILSIVSMFENGGSENQNIPGLNRIQALRDFDKQLVYITWGDAITNQQTPNRVLCYNYIENLWSTFTLSFTALGRYKQTADNTWTTWTSPWKGDTSTWESPIDQNNDLFLLGGRIDSSLYEILDEEMGTDNGTNYNFTIETKRFNPYLEQAKRCDLGYVDLYFTPNALTPIAISAITNAYPCKITTSENHGLSTGSTIVLMDCAGSTSSSNLDMSILNNQQFTITYVSATEFTLNGVDSTNFGTYTASSGNVMLSSEVTVLDYIDDGLDDPIVQKKVMTSANFTEGKYVRVFVNATARLHQIVITLSNGSAPFKIYPPNDTIDNQLDDAVKGVSPFELLGIVYHMKPGGILKQ